MRRLQFFLMMVGFVGLALWGTGCECSRQGVPKQQATGAATAGADKQAQEQIDGLTNELRVTYMELEQEQIKVDVLLDENQNLNEQLRAVTERLLAAESKLSELEKVPRTP